MPPRSRLPFFFFFNDTATTEIYTLSLHDALPISGARGAQGVVAQSRDHERPRRHALREGQADRRARAHEARARLTKALRSEEHTSELQSPDHLVCRLLLEKKKHGMR